MGFSKQEYGSGLLLPSPVLNIKHFIYTFLFNSHFKSLSSALLSLFPFHKWELEVGGWGVENLSIYSESLIKKKKKLVGNCLVRVGVTRLAYLRTAAAAAKSLQSCPTVQPHRRQLTRLPRPWDSPGKNTGVGCHFLLQYMKVKSESEVFQSCPTPSDPMDCSLPGSSVHGIFQARVLEWGAIAFSVSQN